MAVEDLDDIPLADEAEGEPESPYRRRAKAVPVRRGRAQRFRRVARWAAWGLLILPALGYGAYRLAAYAQTSPRFALALGEDVLLSGNQYVTREEVLNALGVPAVGKMALGMNIFKISMTDKRQQLDSIPWVRSATLTRSYPNRLAVHIVERTPVAFVNVEGRVKLVDDDGVILEKPEHASFNFPVLTGLEAANGRSERAARIALFTAFTHETAAEVSTAGWIVSEVDLADADDLKGMFVQAHDTVQLHFGREKFAERFRNFLALLPDLRKSGSKVDSVDLRYGSQVVVTPRTGATEPENTSGTLPSGVREN